MPKQKIIICSGGELGAWALSQLTNYDYLIGADRGAAFLINHGYTPDLSIGDFDSVTPEEFQHIKQNSKEWKTFDAIDKDYTDTELSFIHALKLEPKEIVIIGGIGTRFDHSISNIQLLIRALEQGVKATIVGQYNKILLIDSMQSLELKQDGYQYTSILPLTEQVTGITLTGFQYPLHNATITLGQSLGISNIIVDSTATISIQSGKIIVIQTNDANPSHQ